MGWDFCAYTKEELTETLLKESSFSIKIDHAVVGNHLWVVEGIKGTGSREIVLFLLAQTRQYGGCKWGYKDIPEKFGPYYYDCPERLLAQTTVQNDEWRELRKDWLACKAERKARAAVLKVGTQVRVRPGFSGLSGREFAIEAILPGKKQAKIVGLGYRWKPEFLEIIG